VDLVVNSRIVIPDAELVERFSASGGPGGQHANKASTRVELTWDIATTVAVSESDRRKLIAVLGETVRVVADDKRSQTRNRDIARQRLAQKIREALVVAKPRRATKPSRGSQRRRLESKRRDANRKKLRQRPRHDD
jgi:ribosome-associated protein